MRFLAEKGRNQVVGAAPDSGTWEAEAETSQVQEQTGHITGPYLKQANE